VPARPADVGAAVGEVGALVGGDTIGAADGCDLPPTSIEAVLPALAAVQRWADH